MMPKKSSSATLSTSGNVLRKTGRLERFIGIRHDLGMDTSVVVSARYRNVSGGALDKPTLFTALAKVILRQPALAVQMSSNCKFFLRLEKIDLSQVVEFVGIGVKLQDHIESHLRRGFETSSGRPLWRISLMPDNTVVFAFYHGVADGMSGQAFHRSLLGALNSLQQPVSTYTEVVSVPDDTVLLPNLEKMANLSLSFSAWRHETWENFAPASLQPRGSAWTGNPVVKTPNRDMRARLLHWAPQDTRQMLELCRSHGTTLTGLLGAVAVAVLSKLLAGDPSFQKMETIAIGTPVSLRRFVDVPKDDTVGVFVSVLETFHRIVKVDGDPAQLPWLHFFTWSEAVKYSSSLQKDLEYSLCKVGMIKYLFGRIEQFYKMQPGTKRMATLDISNLGPLKIPDTVSNDPAKGCVWTVEEMDFAQGDGTLGGAMKLNVVSAPSGTLGVAVTWARDSVTDILGEAFAVGMKEAIEEVISSSAAAAKD
ncbi:hypothetical protein CERSUDRAFT_112938 [Gelatoporia subvermispora B]|uniref:Alcohol acetyltransferase n=1 Tax=Ceriporiopsis subvermispora (strain B) TaxID=914234 RepID=M2R419_CERS8|nr:hypothetical protein CERSUDRAFT_112938 [Gelatoporia subvermispora B]